MNPKWANKRNRQGKESKKKQKKKASDRKRRNRRKAMATETASLAGIGRSSVNRTPIIRLHRRDKSLEELKMGNVMDEEDINYFTKIDGRSSSVYVAVDKESREIAFVARVNLYEDMTAQQHDEYQRIFSYFARDRAIKGSQSLKNGAMRGGKMNAVGWRPGYEPGVHVDTYRRGKPRKGQTTENDIREHVIGLTGVHDAISNNFRSLSALIHQNQNSQLRELLVPAAGKHFGAQGDELDESFCSNIAYTFDGFYNTVHCDRDASDFTYGMFGRTEKGSGKLMRKADCSFGDHTAGFSFAVIPYHIQVMLTQIDGVVELIWRGPRDGHCTTSGSTCTGCERMAFSCQIGKGLVRRVEMYGKQYDYELLSDENRRRLHGHATDVELDEENGNRSEGSEYLPY
ncbi:hypothetical protein BJ508DRAFT_334522 [Ascobolus immersus RN42]|uniref:Tet-like 2OG-Fe(II) oxygenase domain-containing protein n=1 Tax=Ascobolus immersus RN42 TaxID=1160509 RepID=A0A3N4HMA9_ASCIM|nr:hypothetical protein BJ508DRAFT_334522 [Ascobolus immersus RN42]